MFLTSLSGLLRGVRSTKRRRHAAAGQAIALPIWPLFDQVAPLRGAGPGVSTAAHAWAVRAAHAGPPRRSQTNTAHT